MNLETLAKNIHANNPQLAWLSKSWEKSTKMRNPTIGATKQSVRLILIRIGLGISVFGLCGRLLTNIDSSHGLAYMLIMFGIGLMATNFGLFFFEDCDHDFHGRNMIEDVCNQNFGRNRWDFSRAISLLEGSLLFTFVDGKSVKVFRVDQKGSSPTVPALLPNGGAFWDESNGRIIIASAEGLLICQADKVKKAEQLPWKENEAKKLRKQFVENHRLLANLLEIRQDHGYYFRDHSEVTS